MKNTCIVILLSLQLNCFSVKSNAETFNMNSLNAVLVNCPINDKQWACEPQLFININLKPNPNLESEDKLLILDEIYEPTTRENFRTMSPYIIVVSWRKQMIRNYPKYTRNCNPGNDCNRDNAFTLCGQRHKKRRKTSNGYFVPEFPSTPIHTNLINNLREMYKMKEAGQYNPDLHSYHTFPYLAAKIRIFRKRMNTWWMIMPPIRLNNLFGTVGYGDILMILKPQEDIFHSKYSAYQEIRSFSNELNYWNSNEDIQKDMSKGYNNNIDQNKRTFNTKSTKDRRFQRKSTSPDKLFPPDIKMWANRSKKNKSFYYKLLDERVPAFSIKMKLPFRENAAQINTLRVKVATIVTDATTKDALQISATVINKGLKSQEFLISIDKCPLSETGSTITTVRKTLLPYISETITFLLPFIMGPKKNVQFVCELIVKGNTLTPQKGNTLDSKIVVSRRSFHIETYSRCFCVWNCHCHCLGRIETHIDLNTCQKMKYNEARDAGLLLNCPSNKDTNDLCLLDSQIENNNSTESESRSLLQKIFGIFLCFIIILLWVLLCGKCFSPRKEDLIVASTEWICQPDCRFDRQSKSSDTMPSDKSVDFPNQSFNEVEDLCTTPSSRLSYKQNKNKNNDSLESAFITLSRQQQALRNQCKRKECR